MLVLYKCVGGALASTILLLPLLWLSLLVVGAANLMIVVIVFVMRCRHIMATFHRIYVYVSFAMRVDGCLCMRVLSARRFRQTNFMYNVPNWLCLAYVQACTTTSVFVCDMVVSSSSLFSSHKFAEVFTNILGVYLESSMGISKCMAFRKWCQMYICELSSCMLCD